MPTSSTPRQEPSAAASAPATIGRRGLLTVLWLTLAAPGLATAGPAPEYGPEAEARFLERCAAGADATAPAAAPCRLLMERLQAELGYPRFLEAAAGGPEAFGRQTGGRLAAASSAGAERASR